MRMMEAYSSAYGAMVSVAPRKRTKRSLKVKATMAKSRATVNEVKKAGLKSSLASLLRFSPKRRLTVLADPWPRVSPMAWMMLMIE